MSLFPPVWSKDTPWGLSTRADVLLEVVAQRVADRFPIPRDWMVEKHGQEWVELYCGFCGLSADGRNVTILPLGIAANTWARGKAEDRQAARREFWRLVRARNPGTLDDLLAEGFALDQERLKLEAGVSDIFREFMPMLAASVRAAL